MPKPNLTPAQQQTVDGLRTRMTAVVSDAAAGNAATITPAQIQEIEALIQLILGLFGEIQATQPVTKKS